MPQPPRPAVRALTAAVVAALVALLAAPQLVAADPASDASYADAAHLALVGREATEAETAAWVATLVGGARRSSLVGPLSQSEELERIAVEAEFLGILGRGPEPAAAAFWLGYLQRRGVTLRMFETRLLASPEFVTGAGPAPESLVEAFYDVILQREPSDEARAYWVGRLATGSTATVARLILGSAEARALDVTSAYESFLGRAVDPGALAFWSDVLLSTGDEQRVWASLVASQEFYDNASGTGSPRRATPTSVPFALLSRR